jgi:hypothetical protein
MVRITAFQKLAGLAALCALLGSSNAQAQYFQAKPGSEKLAVLKSNSTDSVLLFRQTPFDVPATPDSIALTYHEPMPDSIMPRSAMVIGKVRIQAETPEDVVDYLEKYAKKYGADWIVSFTEPRASLNQKRERVYRSTATLLHVLDATFITQSDLSMSYYGENNLGNYAAVTSWFDNYGKHFGSNDVQRAPQVEEETDQDH